MRLFCPLLRRCLITKVMWDWQSSGNWQVAVPPGAHRVGFVRSGGLAGCYDGDSNQNGVIVTRGSFCGQAISEEPDGASLECCPHSDGSWVGCPGLWLHARACSLLLGHSMWETGSPGLRCGPYCKREYLSYAGFLVVRRSAGQINAGSTAR